MSLQDRRTQAIQVRSDLIKALCVWCQSCLALQITSSFVDRRFSGPGTVFLTNYRLVLVPQKPTPQISAMELPLLLIDKHTVSQPIFGANNLSGVCRPVDAPHSGEEIKWKLAFINGGMGTLVPLFYATLEYIRVASRRRAREEETATPPPPQQQPVEQPPPATAPAFLATAFVDPNDPTRIFLTQLVDPATQQAAPPKFPVV